MKRHLLLLALLPSLASHAASFDCAKAQSQDEKAICGHPELSRLDEEMAQTYAQALKGNNTSEVKAAQRQWLKARRKAGSSYLELRPLYIRRITELKHPGTRWSPQDWQNAKGPWSEAGLTETEGEDLNIVDVSAQGFKFEFRSSAHHPGFIEGYARATPTGAFFKSSPCELRFTPLAPGIMKIHPKGCDDPVGIYFFDGVFFQGDHKYVPSLFDLDVLDSPEADQAFRALTGKAYGEFVWRLHYPSWDTQDADGFGAKVTTGFMPGNAPDKAIIMKSRDGHFYAAYLEGGKLHYFSNDSRYAKRLPKTISSWARGTEGL